MLRIIDGDDELKKHSRTSQRNVLIYDLTIIYTTLKGK